MVAFREIWMWNTKYSVTILLSHHSMKCCIQSYSGNYTTLLWQTYLYITFWISITLHLVKHGIWHFAAMSFCVWNAHSVTVHINLLKKRNETYTIHLTIVEMKIIAEVLVSVNNGQMDAPTLTEAGKNNNHHWKRGQKLGPWNRNFLKSREIQCRPSQE